VRILLVHDKDVRLSESGASDTGRARGGVQQYLVNLVKGLTSRGHSVSMVRFCPDPGAGLERGRYYELKSSSIRPSRRTLDALKSIVKTESPDVVHLHSVFYAMNPSMVDWIRNAKPLVYTLHEFSPVCFWNTKVHVSGQLCDFPVGVGCLTRRCYRLGARASVLQDVVRIVADPRHLAAYRKLPRMIVPSRYLARQLVLNGFHAERIEVVVNPSRYEAIGNPDTLDRHVRILFVGRLVAEKGLLHFFDALRLLRTPSWEAVIVGDGPLESYARECANEAAFRGRVRLTGALNGTRLQDEYRAATVVVVPSMAPESFGLAGVEGMAFGKPVVGFDAGGISEWLEHEATGLMTRRGDVPALAKDIDRVLGDRDLRFRLASNGLERVRTRFNSDAHVDKIVTIYESQIAAMRARP